MKYPKLIKKDLKNNLFEYDGGDLWIRENVSFWDDQEICWNNDIVDFIKEEAEEDYLIAAGIQGGMRIL